MGRIGLLFELPLVQPEHRIRNPGGKSSYKSSPSMPLTALPLRCNHGLQQSS